MEKKQRATTKRSTQKKEPSVAEIAYYLSEKRGFHPGDELQDWFEAERIVKGIKK